MVNLNTGAAYRAVALLALERGVGVEQASLLAELAAEVELRPDGVLIGGEAVEETRLRTPEVAAAASEVSVHPEVRHVLLSVQRDAAEASRREGGAVVEGRDIGTVVLPDADLKVFLQAAPEERARRRARQTGREDELERIRAAMSTRDRQDSERQSAPLKIADDAVVVDTTGLSLPDVVRRVLELAHDVRAAKQGA